MQSLSAAAGEPEHHHRHHRHSWHEGHEGHQSLAGDQVPGSVHLHPAPSVGRDWRHVSSARPGPPPGAWCRPRRGHTSRLLHGSREQSPAAVTSNQGGEGKVGGYPLLTGHEDLSKTLVFHVFVRMTARYTGLPSAKVGCLSYVRGCRPAPPRAVWRVFIRKFYILTFSGWRCIIQQQPGHNTQQAACAVPGLARTRLGTRRQHRAAAGPELITQAGD